jgi:hypothetical protein
MAQYSTAGGPVVGWKGDQPRPGRGARIRSRILKGSAVFRGSVKIRGLGAVANCCAMRKALAFGICRMLHAPTDMDGIINSMMVTRQERIDDFTHEGIPPLGQGLELLCDDHVGTYVIPFLCRWNNGVWQSIAAGRPIEATVVDWRVP